MPLSLKLSLISPPDFEILIRFEMNKLTLN